MQEAVTVAAPTPAAPTLAVDAKPRTLFCATETADEFVLLHVRGIPVMTMPAESTAVASTLKVELIR